MEKPTPGLVICIGLFIPSRVPVFNCMPHIAAIAGIRVVFFHQKQDTEFPIGPELRFDAGSWFQVVL